MKFEISNPVHIVYNSTDHMYDRQQHVRFSWHWIGHNPFQINHSDPVNDIRVGNITQYIPESIGGL